MLEDTDYFLWRINTKHLVYWGIVNIQSHIQVYHQKIERQLINKETPCFTQITIKSCYLYNSAQRCHSPCSSWLKNQDCYSLGWFAGCERRCEECQWMLGKALPRKVFVTSVSEGGVLPTLIQLSSIPTLCGCLNSTWVLKRVCPWV